MLSPKKSIDAIEVWHDMRRGKAQLRNGERMEFASCKASHHVADRKELREVVKKPSPCLRPVSVV